MDKQHEKLMGQAANARLVHLNEQLVFPLLQSRIEQTLAAACFELSSTGIASVGKLAYIAACRDLIQELGAIARNGDRAVSKLDHKLE